jgi:hypothetical protein
MPAFGLGALFLGASELALRLAGFEHPSPGRRIVVWSTENDVELRSGTGLHVLDRHQMWKPRPGARIPWTKDERVNALGFRGPVLPLEKSKGRVRIALLGPSTTFGEGVEWSDTFGALLVRSLASLGVDAEVLNAGVMGSTLRQGLERYRRDVRPFAPDIVVSAYSGLHEHTQGALCLTDEDRIVRGLGMPGGSGEPDAYRLRDGVRVLHALAFLSDVYFGTWWREREAAMHEARLAKTIGTFDSPGARRVSPQGMRDGLLELASSVRADGGELYVLLIPHKPGGPLDSPMMHYYQTALQIGCELAHTPVVQGRLAYFQGVTSGGIAPDELFLEDGESSGCGHELLAQALVDALLPRAVALAR